MKRHVRHNYRDYLCYVGPSTEDIIVETQLSRFDGAIPVCPMPEAMMRPIARLLQMCTPRWRRRVLQRAETAEATVSSTPSRHDSPWRVLCDRPAEVLRARAKTSSWRSADELAGIHFEGPVSYERYGAQDPTFIVDPDAGADARTSPATARIVFC